MPSESQQMAGAGEVRDSQRQPRAGRYWVQSEKVPTPRRGQMASQGSQGGLEMLGCRGKKAQVANDERHSVPGHPTEQLPVRIAEGKDHQVQDQGYWSDPLAHPGLGAVREGDPHVHS